MTSVHLHLLGIQQQNAHHNVVGVIFSLAPLDRTYITR